MLLALIDLCVESGHPPSVLTTPQLARRVVELYWPQARPFETRPDQNDRRTLLQNRGGQASVVRLISAYQQAHPDELSPPRRGPAGYPPAYQALLDAVEWVLVEYPLPRLQRVAGGEERFLYVINWGATPRTLAGQTYLRVSLPVCSEIDTNSPRKANCRHKRWRSVWLAASVKCPR